MYSIWSDFTFWSELLYASYNRTIGYNNNLLVQGGGMLKTHKMKGKMKCLDSAWKLYLLLKILLAKSNPSRFNYFNCNIRGWVEVMTKIYCFHLFFSLEWFHKNARMRQYVFPNSPETCWSLENCSSNKIP